MARTITDKQYQKKYEELIKSIHQEVKPFTDDSDEAKKNRRKKASKDLLYFCKTYLPDYFEYDFEQGHYDIEGALTNWNKIIQVLGFRGVGKSTLIATGYALQCVLFKKTRFLPVISDTDTQAKLLMLPIKAELEANARIKQDFGDMRGSEWGEDDFVTISNVRVKSYSWSTFKRGQKHMQWRAKIAICDDLESLNSVKNKDQVDKRYNALTGDVFSGLDLKKEWQLIVICNKLARYDLAHLLEKNEAVLTVAIKSETEDGRATHPKSFPKKVLNDIKKNIGVVVYNREYLLKIISSEDDDFQENWLTYIDEPDRYKYIVMALDPSVGSTEGHDTKAWTVLGLTDDDKHIDLIWSWIRRTTINSMCRQGFSLNRRFNPHKVVVEANGFQILLKDKFREMAKAEESGFSFIAKIKQIINKVNKNSRILRLQGPVENGTFRIVRGAGDNDRFVNHALEFDSSITTNVDDALDSAEMAVGEIYVLQGRNSNVEVEIIG